ncbi:MAG TPA: hypothetical protein PKI61_03940 [bacterium]|nr:hypothetical protein [bacterium]HPT29778.1 hypothetical protein [bacterium]
MNLSIKKAIFCLFSLVLFWTLFMAVDQALAAGDYGLTETVSQGSLQSAFAVNEVGSNPGQFLSSRIGQIVGAILSFVGVILLILIIYAGILWMTASGNEKNVEKAKNIIISAIIGLIIVLSAYAITAFVGRQLTTAPAQTPPSTNTPEAPAGGGLTGS